jgi:hypothetical protein
VEEKLDAVVQLKGDGTKGYTSVHIKDAFGFLIEGETKTSE